MCGGDLELHPEAGDRTAQFVGGIRERRRRGGDRAEHLVLVPQNDQFRERIAAVGEHRREIDGDPAQCRVAEAV